MNEFISSEQYGTIVSGMRILLWKRESMKRRIAVFANGWSNEYLELVIEGIRKRVAEENIDLFTFVNFSSGNPDEPMNIGARGIVKLPDLKEFDGVILAANTINIALEREYLSREIRKYHLPAVSLEYEIDGIPSIMTDTYHGVYDLVTHVIEEHQARKFLFVSGVRDNMESNQRLEATESALEKHGMSLTEEQILVSDWSYHLAYNNIIKYIEAGKELPDAIICANDEMAMGICVALEHLKIRVPEQVIVTGCDCIQAGQIFYPILSTVERKWDGLGYEGMDLLLKQLDGQEVPMKTVKHSSVVVGESCGCEVSQERKEKRLRAILKFSRNQKESDMNEWHLRYVDELLAQITSEEELRTTIQRCFEYNHAYEGADFFLCMVKDFFDEEGQLVSGGYPKYMDTYVNIHGGKAVNTPVFPARQLLPDYEEADGSNIYLFLAFHVDEKCIGYIMQKNHMKGVYDRTLYTWLQHIAHDMVRVKQNIRLEELNARLRDVSVTDALTGLRNRTGFDVLALPYLQRCQKEGKNSAIVFADINHMKVINDKYGHLQGDASICTVAEAIKKTLPQDWIAVRYGGDEFIMVGECEDMEAAEKIKEELAENLEQVKTRRNLCFELTASIGAVIMHPGEPYSLDEYLRKADAAMYATKQKYHQNEKNKKI